MTTNHYRMLRSVPLGFILGLLLSAVVVFL